MIAHPRFTAEDADRAYDEWGANCGPGAVAAICGLTLDELRPFMGDFEQKRYTNPTLMWQVLDALAVRRRLVRPPCRWPEFGLARVQWEGPWTADGVPMMARYRHTHWVGAAKGRDGSTGVFDINAIGNGSGWCALADWESTIVPWITGAIKRASGGWHLTHVVEIDREASS